MTTVRYLPQQTYTVGNGPYLHGAGPYSLSIADVNGDGRLDLIAGNYGDDTISVLLGNGDGTFQSQTTFTTGYSFGLPAIPACGTAKSTRNIENTRTLILLRHLL